jgi:hypothetical protein
MKHINHTKILCTFALIVSLALVARNSFSPKDNLSANSIRFQRSTKMMTEAVPLLTSTKLNVSGKEIIANIHRGHDFELIRLWTIIQNDYQLLYTLQSGRREEYEKPVSFRQKGEDFIYVATKPSGSAGFITETILWVAPDETLHPIEYQDAGTEYESRVDENNEVVLSGGPGIIFAHDELKFQFFIAKPEDPHCCPTAGKVTGLYALQGGKKYDSLTNKYSCTFKISPADFKRTDISQEESAEFNSSSAR